MKVGEVRTPIGSTPININAGKKQKKHVKRREGHADSNLSCLSHRTAEREKEKGRRVGLVVIMTAVEKIQVPGNFVGSQEDAHKTENLNARTYKKMKKK